MIDWNVPSFIINEFENENSYVIELPGLIVALLGSRSGVGKLLISVPSEPIELP